MPAKFKRGHIETYLAILVALAMKGELPITRVMYAANLSWNSLTENLDYLVACGVIRVDRDRVTGRTSVALTDRGAKCLEHILELNKLLHFLPEALERTLNEKEYRLVEVLMLPE